MQRQSNQQLYRASGDEEILTVRFDIRARLRESTAAVHERLHRHKGFAAAAAGTISLEDYRLLLSRLWGFHRAFERVFGQINHEEDAGIEFEERARSSMLESDLVALGADRGSIRGLPQCETLRPPRNAHEFMGALYVIEGSTLGGVQLARALKSVVASGSGEGRSFFLGYGDRHSAMWRSFLARLEECVRSEADGTAVVAGATRTFDDFETWMDEWNAGAKPIAPRTDLRI
jgi:heme oxygenase